MAEDTTTQGRKKGADELKLEEESAIAKLKQAKAEAEYNAAKALDDIKKLSAPAALKSAQQNAESEKAIAQARRDTINARREAYKGPEISAPSGKITSNDGVFIESRLLSSATLDKALTKLCTKIYESVIVKSAADKDKITFVLYNSADLPAIELYSSISMQLSEMESAYLKLNTRADELVKRAMDLTAPMNVRLMDPLIIGFAASGLLRSVGEIVSLLATSTDFNNFDQLLDDHLLVASFAKSVRENKHNWRIFYPSAFPLDTVVSSSSSIFVSKLNQIHSRSEESKKYVRDMEIKLQDLQGLYLAQDNEANRLKVKLFSDEISTSLNELKSLNQAFDHLQVVLSESDGQTKINAQTLLIRAERIVTKLSDQDVYTLMLSATSKGSNRVTENLFLGSQITYSGGTEINCLIFDASGAVVFSDTQIEYTAFLKSEEIRRQVNLNS